MCVSIVFFLNGWLAAGGWWLVAAAAAWARAAWALAATTALGAGGRNRLPCPTPPVPRAAAPAPLRSTGSAGCAWWWWGRASCCTRSARWWGTRRPGPHTLPPRCAYVLAPGPCLSPHPIPHSMRLCICTPAVRACHPCQALPCVPATGGHGGGGDARHGPRVCPAPSAQDQRRWGGPAVPAHSAHSRLCSLAGPRSRAPPEQMPACLTRQAAVQRPLSPTYPQQQPHHQPHTHTHSLACCHTRLAAPCPPHPPPLLLPTDLNTPMAPELGLFLDECYFDAYNAQWAALHSRLALADFQREADAFKVGLRGGEGVWDVCGAWWRGAPLWCLCVWGGAFLWWWWCVVVCVCARARVGVACSATAEGRRRASRQVCLCGACQEPGAAPPLVCHSAALAAPAPAPCNAGAARVPSHRGAGCGGGRERRLAAHPQRGRLRLQARSRPAQAAGARQPRGAAGRRAGHCMTQSMAQHALLYLSHSPHLPCPLPAWRSKWEQQVSAIRQGGGRQPPPKGAGAAALVGGMETYGQQKRLHSGGGGRGGRGQAKRMCGASFGGRAGRVLPPPQQRQASGGGGGAPVAELSD